MSYIIKMQLIPSDVVVIAGSFARVVTYIKQLLYVHFLVDLFSKYILVLSNKHNVGVC